MLAVMSKKEKNMNQKPKMQKELKINLFKKQERK
jgi:hypothetical protein